MFKHLFDVKIPVSKTKTAIAIAYLDHFLPVITFVLLTLISCGVWWFFHQNNLGLAYNDARSHLDIGRRVVEGLKPGLAQLGSVWLPLPHILMIPTIWNDFMWHSGLSGALQSMLSYVVTGVLIERILRKLGVSVWGRIVGVVVFAVNLNILYLQSTAMTELLLISTMTASVWELVNFTETDKIHYLIRCAFWVMLSTLVRYDGWFLFGYITMLLVVFAWLKRGYKMAEGTFVLFCTLGGFGIFMWFVWNAVIFKDPLYFAFGPYSAHAQQQQLADAGVLITQKNWWQSVETYWFAMVYNSGVLTVLFGFIGSVFMWLDKRIPLKVRFATTALMAPLVFNIIALYLGFSVLFVQNLNGNTWFNVRYGVMMVPSFAVFCGYLIDRLKPYRYTIAALLALTLVFAGLNMDAVTIDDGRVGSSQKNVSEVSGWLTTHVQNEPGFVLISAASHDAIIFSSGLPMTRFIHEGTGKYWESATTSPDRWARWIVMRTNDNNDLTFRLVSQSGSLDKYNLVESYPFADVYELKPEYLSNLQTDLVYGKQK